MKPIERLAIGLLYFNKGLPQFERQLYAARDLVLHSGLVQEVTFFERYGMSVDMARDKITTDMMRHGDDAIIWVDTDLIFADTAFVALVNMANAGHQVAAGIYRRGLPPHMLLTKRASIEWATLEELREHEQGGVTRVLMTAGGFSIVRREVYDAVLDGLGTPWYCNYDHDAKSWCGEDTYFYIRLARLGISAVVDPDLHAVHWSAHGPVPVVDDQPEMRFCL